MATKLPAAVLGHAVEGVAYSYEPQQDPIAFSQSVIERLDSVHGLPTSCLAIQRSRAAVTVAPLPGRDDIFDMGWEHREPIKDTS